MKEYKMKEIKKFEMFQDLNNETYEILKKNAHIEKFKAKTILLTERKMCEYVYFILDGIVSLYKMNTNGQKKIIFMLNEGHFVNEELSLNMSSCVGAEIFENAELLCVPKNIIMEIIRSDGEFAVNIYASVSSKVRRLYRQLKNTPHSIKLEKRVASKLYKLAIDYGKKTDKGIEIKMDLSITYLADLLGSQRESVSRSLKVLYNEGLVNYDDKRFIVTDLQALSKYFKNL